MALRRECGNTFSRDGAIALKTIVPSASVKGTILASSISLERSGPVKVTDANSSKKAAA